MKAFSRFLTRRRAKKFVHHAGFARRLVEAHNWLMNNRLTCTILGMGVLSSPNPRSLGIHAKAEAKYAPPPPPCGTEQHRTKPK